ncbi:hypothetical protein M231_07854 [Tremella mesenterica]|uniref:Rap-GAP domain-containing protein n=1 Tax=Tremella mesenterica TaxID=5217 RepID=A0A4V1M2X5_TREME|nr:hypothetical protein M231_07854 [Tremella mesenterica]
MPHRDKMSERRASALGIGQGTESGSQSHHPPPPLPSTQPPAPTPGAGLSARGFLPMIFGITRPANASSRSSSSSETRKLTDNSAERSASTRRSPESSRATILLEQQARPPTPPPFDFDEAVRILQDEEASSDELAENAKAVAVWIANLYIDNEDIFGLTDSSKLIPRVEQNKIDALYKVAIHLAGERSSQSTTLRTSAIRLLAALIGASPPPPSLIDTSPDTPYLTIPAVYQVITLSNSIVDVDQIFVKIGALKALTKNGADVRYMTGIIGYLVRLLPNLSDEWISWCGKRNEPPVDWFQPSLGSAHPYGPLKPATVAQAIIAIFDLLCGIISKNIILFTSEDYTRIIQPMLDLLWCGVSASASIGDEKVSLGVAASTTSTRRNSPASTTLNSPSKLNANIPIGPEHPSRSSTSRSRQTTTSSRGTPGNSRHTPRQPSTSGLTSPPVAAGFTVPSPSVRSSFSRQAPMQCSLKWTMILPSFCLFVETLATDSLIGDTDLEKVVALLCLAFGQDQEDTMPDYGWAAATQLLVVVTSSRGGRRCEQAIRNILAGRRVVISVSDAARMPSEDRKVTRGAVVASRRFLPSLDNDPNSTIVLSLASLLPSLKAAQSFSRFPGENQQGERARWQPVDYEILAFLQDHLSWLEEDGTTSRRPGDVWIEGQTACELLLNMIPVVSDLRKEQLASDALFTRQVDAIHPLVDIMSSIIRQIPSAINRLRPSTSDALPFYHPKYIELLLELSIYLDEPTASIVVEYYQRECLCLPHHQRWIPNIWKLIKAFFLTSSNLPATRQKLTIFLFKDVYAYAEDLPEYRSEYVDQVIVPFLEQVLVDAQDEDFQKLALDVLVSAAVAETLERDEERRRARATMSTPMLVAEDAAPLPSDSVKEAAAGGSFHSIRKLIIRMAAQTPCKGELDPTRTQSPPSSTVVSPQLGSTDLNRSRSTKAAAARAQLSLSPQSKTADLPSISATMASLDNSRQTDSPPSTGHRTKPPHSTCKSVHAVVALIAIFTRLAFSSASSPGSLVKAARTPASTRCITIYRDLLGLLFPMTSSSLEASASSSAVPARCPRARIIILQWLMRLRADGKHRIFIRRRIDIAAMPFAEILHRTRQGDATIDPPDTRRVRTPAGPSRSENNEERGRASRNRDEGHRSRSRSKQPPITRGPEPVSYNPLWFIPEPPIFELPPDALPSEGMTTYNPNFPSLRDEASPPVEGVWLPVSEYLRVLNGIIRSHDWELVSYVLSFLPLQLRNKPFFHGARAATEVRALVEALCEGVMSTSLPWEKRFNVPSFITRIKINAVAYQSLSILISYSSILSREQNDLLIQAFAEGLQGRREVSKPVIQALTLCVYELDTYLGRHLLAIVERMKDIISTTAIAVHILEFLVAVCRHGQLFKNFTQDHYRLVFAVATGYISEHNARSEQPAGDRQEFTLSQQVIDLAYFSIYVWFMAIKLPQRHLYVSDIVKRLVQAKSRRTAVDEKAEVCFDWLARYTYGNADPQPAKSFLGDLVMSDENEEAIKKQSWLLEREIVTIWVNARSGWTRIEITRPTGTILQTGKLENVPLLDLGEANADLVTLPAVLMANRTILRPSTEEASTAKDLSIAGAENEEQIGKVSSEDIVKKIVNVKSSVPPPEDFDRDSQHGYIWSGATPSQRRKDVAIEPAYVFLQLLSAYPYSSLDAPRGRIIPSEEKYMRALKNIGYTPVIDTMKIAVIYVAPGQIAEDEILSNIDGSPLYLDFLQGLGRILRLKGQVDVSVGGLDTEDDSDGEYAYAWWDDLTQTVYHTVTMMPNLETSTQNNKKRLIGNDFVKIVYNDSGGIFAFDTIKTAFNLINIIITPHSPATALTSVPEDQYGGDFFTVTLQRAPGIPDFSPLGEGKVVSRRSLPILVRQIAQLANDMAARFTHIRDASDMSQAEYITPWRSRWQAIERLRANLPPVEIPDEDDTLAREVLLREPLSEFHSQIVLHKRQFPYGGRAVGGIKPTMDDNGGARVVTQL